MVVPVSDCTSSAIYNAVICSVRTGMEGQEMTCKTQSGAHNPVESEHVEKQYFILTAACNVLAIQEPSIFCGLSLRLNPPMVECYRIDGRRSNGPLQK